MIDTKYSPIDCGDYDYLEIACMDRYDVEISLRGELLRGVASNLEIISGEEFLVLKFRDSPDAKIRIDRIDLIRVMSRPCRFQKHAFGRTFSNPE